MTEIKYITTGRRKTSIARVRMSPGSGQITVNEKTLGDYFPRETLQMIIRQPLEIAGMINKYNITAKVEGGGLTGQAGALRHGISRAIVSMDNALKLKLKKEGFITRDPRKKERKKFGQKAARKRFQFSKR